LWRYFFTVNLQKKREKAGRQELQMSMGCAGIQLQNNQVSEYPSMWLLMSNKGWNAQWFYLKNDATAPLPEFTRSLIEEAPEQWRKWGVLEKDKKKIQDHITAIHILKKNSLKGSGVIGAYHVRRVVPLMTRTLLVYVMVPEASFDGTTLAEGTLPNSKIAQRINEAMEPLWDDTGAALDFVYPVLGHPLMQPEPGYVVFISFPFSYLLFN